MAEEDRQIKNAESTHEKHCPGNCLHREFEIRTHGPDIVVDSENEY